ncbi:MAG: alpha/beta hydrolase [Polyangiales bacterium]
MLPVKDFVIRQVRTAVYDSDPHGSREAVVFVHGNPGPMDDWDDLAPAVAQFARVVAMDLPGYGRAEHPHHFDFTVEGYARFLGELLERIGVERVHLVLHDFGGGFGLRWAADHPEQFASVTLINTGVLPGYKWHRYARIWQTPILGELFQLTATAKLMKRALDADNPKPMPQSYVDRVMSYADWHHLRAVLQLYRNSRDPEATFSEALPLLRALDRPACVIWGAGDSYLPVKYAAVQREAFPHAEVHVLEGLGHWPFIDDPAAVSGILVEFLRRQISSAVAAQ